MAAAGQAFNEKVKAYTANGELDLKQIATNVASMKAFVAELGSNKQAWAQVDRIGEVRAQGDGKVSDITFTVKNNDAFIGAIKADSRFRFSESDMGHKDSARLIGMGP